VPLQHNVTSALKKYGPDNDGNKFRDASCWKIPLSSPLNKFEIDLFKFSIRFTPSQYLIITHVNLIIAVVWFLKKKFEHNYFLKHNEKCQIWHRK